MSGTPPDSPEVEEGSPFGGAECEESSPEPAQETSCDGDQEEEPFPFVNVAVELYEDPDATNLKDTELNDEHSEPPAKIQDVENIESTPDVGNFPSISTEVSDGNGNVTPDSTGQDINEDSEAASAAFNAKAITDVYDASYVIKSEPNYKHLQKSYLEDFIYSNASSYDEGSNSNFDDSREEPKGSPLSRFPKIVKAIEVAEYETLQVLFQLLYQRSAWDTQEILSHGILEFSGFNFNRNSEDYFNREMMLRTQPDEMLAKIGTILGVEQVYRMISDMAGLGRLELVSSIMSFLSKPSKKTRPSRSIGTSKEEAATTLAKIPSKCGCRSRCVQRFSKSERNRLLEYMKELEEKKLMDNYLMHLMECKKIVRSPESLETCKKLKEVFYQYKCFFGTKKQFIVCKGGFCLLHGIKMGKINQLQNKLKSGQFSSKIDINDFPPIVDETANTVNLQVEEQKNESKNVQRFSPRKRQLPAGQVKKVWVSSEEQIRRMEEELKDNIDLSSCESDRKPLEEKKSEPSAAEEKIKDETIEVKTEKVKLKDFPLVVKSIENAAEELLIDVHFLLFLSSADVDKVKSNILEFEGFSFDKDSEEYDERNEFLRRMSFKIVSDVASSFSVEVFNTKEETIQNLLKFLSKPEESFLRATVSMPLSLSDVELDDFGDMSDSDVSITCEVVEKKVECITLLSSGEDSDGENKPKKAKHSSPAKAIAPKPSQPVVMQTSAVVHPTTASTATSSASAVPETATSQSKSAPGTRRLRDFETICKIVNTHPHEYLVDIFELLYLKKHEPSTLRADILNFSGFTFEMKSPEYIKRKQLLDRMLYNSVRRIYNTLIHNTTEVKVFSKPTMITEIFQFLFNLPDHDTSVRPPPVVRAAIKPAGSLVVKNPTAASGAPAAGLSLSAQTGKLSDLKRVFQRVACFPCEYLIDVHKLLFMTDCDPKVIRQNIFAFKGFNFEVESQEFQQRKMYLEYLTFHSLRKISSVLTTRSVDLRNSTKHELATHLTQVLAEYTKLKVDDDVLPPGVAKQLNQNNVNNTSAVSSTTPVENIVVTPIIDPSLASPSPAVETSQSSVETPTPSSQMNTPVILSTSSAPLAISIVDARSVNMSPVTTTVAPSASPNTRRKRKASPAKQSKPAKRKEISPRPEVPAPSQFADVNLPEVEQYREIYGQIYNPSVSPITGIATIVPVVNTFNQAIPIQGVQQPNQLISIPQTISPTIVTQVPSKQKEIVVPGECLADSDETSAKKAKSNVSVSKKGGVEETAAFHNKIRDAVTDDDEDCDKPLSSLVGHPIDSVLKKHIVDIVEQSNLESITINGVIQKIFNLYPKFDLSYRKEFIKSTLRSMLYRLGEKGSANTEKRDTNSPDCSVTTTDNSETVSDAAVECS